MQYTTLGNTGLVVSRLGLGTMLFGGTETRDTPKKDALAMVGEYLDAGGNHVDTADIYTEGASEEIVGEAIASCRDEVVLATKARFRTGVGFNAAGLSRKHIFYAVEQSLRRLKTDYIDLYYMHCWDPLTSLEESLRAFEDLVRQGKIRYVGVSNFKAWQVAKALGIAEKERYLRFAAAQYQYSLVKRDIEYEVADLCAAEDIGIVPWGVLGGGFLSGKYKSDEAPTSGRIAGTWEGAEEAWGRRNIDKNWRILEVVDAIAKKRGTTYACVALAWAVAQPAVSSVLIGARTLAQFREVIQTADLELSGEELRSLREVSALPELYPYRMIEVYGARKPGN